MVACREGTERGSGVAGPSLTSILGGDRWSVPQPGNFMPGKGHRYSLYRKVGGPGGT